ncbi:hypothetical protein MRB53_006390 [Persea americana]|uniref:Uncharacterized protein n=1 Tax=Persea americana TaxID=3435 RepID=A0ACC2MHJ4_PERAE|nr:hypothetical protein MRB53_006390 [Persea americana]
MVSSGPSCAAAATSCSIKIPEFAHLEHPHELSEERRCSPMIHDGDESSEVEKVDDSEMARNFKTLDEGMGSGNGMEME